MTTQATTTTRPDERLVERLARPTEEELAALDAWWRANNYLTVGQIYLMANPLLREPLTDADIKPRLLGHWGTSPGLSFVYAHCSRLIQATGQEMIYLTGPGHGGPALVAASYLEGSYTERFPQVTQDVDGIRRLFRQFSAPGGIPSHVSVTTPGSIHEGGELGYVLVHAFGSVMDNPELITLAVVGDGEAETGPLEGSWKGVSFLNPQRDGAVLAGAAPQRGQDRRAHGARPQGPGRGPRAAVGPRLRRDRGGGVRPPRHAPPLRRRARRGVRPRSAAIQADARGGDWDGTRPRWPMIILRSPKGWTGPDVVDGVQMQGTWRAHQVPLSGVKDNPEHLALLEQWLRSYRPEELFDEDGAPTELVRRANPSGDLRMSASPHANGGLLTRDLDLPDFRDYAIDVPSPATLACRVDAQARRADARRLPRQRRPRSGCSAPTRRTATGSARCSRRRTARSPSGSRPRTSRCRGTAGSWRCSPSTTATDGSRATR